MSSIKKLLLSLVSTIGHPPSAPDEKSYGIPTVKFDPARVTSEVKRHIRKNLEQIEEVPSKCFDRIYDAAILSVTKGRNLDVLSNALLVNIDGMTKGRAAQIALSLNNKASAIITREGQKSLGITEATWILTNAGMRIPRPSHIAADGKRYKVAEGMYLDGKWTWPGYEDDCLCFSRPIIPGLNN